MTVEQLTQEIIPRGRGTPSPHAPGPPLLLSSPSPDARARPLPTARRVRVLLRAGTVPDDIKAELLQRIRKFAEQA